jgi:bifunctional NMN adenylyltransferase/nudix hydrolase
MKTAADIVFQPEIGVIVGRFQSPYLHAGYKNIIDIVIEKHPRVFIFVGQSQLKCTHHDPLKLQNAKGNVRNGIS